MTFLIALHDSFSQIRGQILLSDPLPPISNVFSLILQEEFQREIIDTQSLNNSESLAFSVNSSKKPLIDKQKFAKKSRPRCTHYDTLGHTKETCYKIVGYTPPPIISRIDQIRMLIMLMALLNKTPHIILH